MISTVTAAVFVVVLALAAVSDLRTRRIPNVLTVTGFAFALVLQAALGGGAFAEALLGAGVALLLLLPLFAVGGMGGGDAKLLIVAGAFLGPADFMMALLYAALAGGGMALFEAARRGVILPVLFNTGGLLKYWMSFGRNGERLSLASPGAVSVPYGVAIGIGCTTALFLGGGI